MIADIAIVPLKFRIILFWDYFILLTYTYFHTNNLRFNEYAYFNKFFVLVQYVIYFELKEWGFKVGMLLLCTLF